LSPQDGLSRLLQTFAGAFDSPLETGFETPFPVGGVPAVDMHDGKDALTVRAELPGMKKEDIDISLEGGVLTLSGERKGGCECESGGASHCERWVGRFQRSISLPYQVDTKTIKAAYTDGVLTVTLAKAEEAKAKKIKVQFN
jgi:HSP20 family protein